ncbi:MAG: glycosyltransferase family 4 protein [Nitrospirota bacterium]
MLQLKRVKLKSCSINLGELCNLNDFGFFHPFFHCITENGHEFVARMRLHVTEPLNKLIFVDPRYFPDGGFVVNSSGSPVLNRCDSFSNTSNSPNKVLRPDILRNVLLYEISDNEIKKSLLDGYNFQSECISYQSDHANDIQIAFTCHDPNIIGGGNIILFRFINWLSDLGVKAIVYSCGSLPTWTRVCAKFRIFGSYQEMFDAINESIVILFSVWHIEPILKTNPTGKKIYHLRQIVENYHYGTDYHSMMIRKPVLDLLESLPIGVITVSPHLRHWYKNELGIDSLLIPNGIDLGIFFPSQTKKKPAKNIWKIASVGDPVHFVKGVDVLAQALLLLAKRRPNLHLEWHLAFGQARSFDMGLCNLKNLQIFPHVGLKHIQMRQFYQDADLYVNHSLYEGFGLPTLEAMACGIPVIQADNRGLDFIVKDGCNCLLVPINDPPKLSDAIEKIISDEKLANQFKAQGILTAKKYSIRQQFSYFIDVFEKNILNTSFPKEKISNIYNKIDTFRHLNRIK